MVTIPAIDMVATGKNIAKLRKDAGLTVRDLQEMFGFTTPQAFTSGSTALCHLMTLYKLVRRDDNTNRTKIRSIKIFSISRIFWLLRQGNFEDYHEKTF